MKDKVKIEYIPQEDEYGVVRVTSRYMSAIKREANRQKLERQIIRLSKENNLILQEDWKDPDGFEVFEEDD